MFDGHLPGKPDPAREAEKAARFFEAMEFRTRRANPHPLVKPYLPDRIVHVDDFLEDVLGP
jgi:hypothetical protein